MKRSRAYNVESTLRMGATFVEGSSSIILCAYVVLYYLCVYVKYCIYFINTLSIYFTLYLTYTLHYITLDEIFII